MRGEADAQVCRNDEGTGENSADDKADAGSRTGKHKKPPRRRATEPVRIREREQKRNKRNHPAQESSSDDVREYRNVELLADRSQPGDWRKLTGGGNS